MKMFCGLCVFWLSVGASVAFAQVRQIEPRVLRKDEARGKVTVVEVAAGFVTTIRLPDVVNSVVVGDPSSFQVEHSDREPKLVFVKATSRKPGETNLLISTVSGHQVSLLVVNRGDGSPDLRAIDFLLKYEVSEGFFVPPSAFPSALVGATVPLTQAGSITTDGADAIPSVSPRPGASPSTTESSPENLHAVSSVEPTGTDLDKLLEQQESAPLPTLYGEHIDEESTSGDRVRAGVSRVIDGGEQVIVLFSVVNPTKHAILLMPPQVQLGGRTTSGKIIHHKKWSTAEQLPIEDFRLDRRRLGLGQRADGVVVFVRPPYKQSSETLLLQVAESGAVDRPALAPIGFGVNTSSEERDGKRK